jgi:hypothetical protein
LIVVTDALAFTEARAEKPVELASLRMVEA